MAAMEDPASLKRKDSLLSGVRMAFHKEDAILLDLDGLPKDLAAALREYDFDGDGNVSVNEIVAGARTLKRQKEKARAQRRRAFANNPNAACLAPRCRGAAERHLRQSHHPAGRLLVLAAGCALRSGAYHICGDVRCMCVGATQHHSCGSAIGADEDVRSAHVARSSLLSKLLRGCCNCLR
jgi:hypothetical protein